MGGVAADGGSITAVLEKHTVRRLLFGRMQALIKGEIMSSWHSYPKVWSIGHAGVAELFLDPIHIEEKVDGSQFSFGVFNGELKCKSKSNELVLDSPEKMFAQAVATVREIQHLLTDGWTYRAEYLQKPKHNVLAYDRIPAKHLILFDVNSGHEAYLDYASKRIEADRLGLECVPLLYNGMVDGPGQLLSLLETVSCLGGQKIEGFVVKNYRRFGADKKALLGKYVSEAFKEKHKVDWKEGNPGQNDIVLKVINTYKTGARWDKAIQHVRERGELENSPRDIGKLMKEISVDILSECGDEMKEMLFKWAWPQISRGLTRGLPEYYKEKLLKSAFSADELPTSGTAALESA